MLHSKLFSILVISIGASCLAGCGGGGGDGDEATNVSGTWRAALIKSSDTCAQKGPAAINVTHTVNQNEDAINLQAESGVTFIGNTVGENGFSVDGNHPTIGSDECSDQTRIEYDSINDDSDPSAEIIITINRSCSGALPCTLEYTGTASRAASPATNPTPQATAAPGITPTAGGCPAINPNPAAGTYGGDGGCGISDTTFRYQNNVVVLEPLASNGVTSFNVDPVNNSLATSVSSDLTILGQTGSTCSMVCSAPGTFTVRCSKEGGVSCVEKF